MKQQEFTIFVGDKAPRLLRVGAQKLATMIRAGLLAMLALLGAPLASEARTSKALPRLCFLTFDPGTLQTRSPRFDEFFQGLRDLGYVDGHRYQLPLRGQQRRSVSQPDQRLPEPQA